MRDDVYRTETDVVDWRVQVCRICEQHTHKYSTYRVAQPHHISSLRTRVAQELESSGLHIFVSLKLASTCHVLFFAAPDTDHQHKFSLTHFHPFLLSFRRSHLYKQALWFSTQSGGSTQIPSLTGYEPKSVEIKAIETEAIEPEDLEPRRN